LFFNIDCCSTDLNSSTLSRVMRIDKFLSTWRIEHVDGYE